MWITRRRRWVTTNLWGRRERYFIWTRLEEGYLPFDVFFPMFHQCGHYPKSLFAIAIRSENRGAGGDARQLAYIWGVQYDKRGCYCWDLCGAPSGWRDLLLVRCLISSKLGTEMELLHWLAIFYFLCSHALKLLQRLVKHTFNLTVTTSKSAPCGAAFYYLNVFMVFAELSCHWQTTFSERLLRNFSNSRYYSNHRSYLRMLTSVGSYLMGIWAVGQPDRVWQRRLSMLSWSTYIIVCIRWVWGCCDTGWRD